MFRDRNDRKAAAQFPEGQETAPLFYVTGNSEEFPVT